MKQGSLFGPPGAYGDFSGPLASRTDPETSHEAAKKHRESGKLHGHAMIVLKLLKEHPESTFSELFKAASVEDQKELVDDKEVCRRLNDLRRMGLAKRVTDKAGDEVKRACRVNGSSKTVWVAI